jgi:Zn-dependent peptidase ImmA (M78 family)
MIEMKAQRGEKRLAIDLLDLVEEERNKISSSPPNSGAYIIEDKEDACLLDKRLVQFVTVGKEISAACWNADGNLNVKKLADKYNCTIAESEDPVKDLTEFALREGYEEILEDLARKNDRINGYSIPKYNKIVYRKGIADNQLNFVLVHEISHCILNHQGKVFYKTSSSESKTLDEWLNYFDILAESYGCFQEPEEYREEADRLAAILLMPLDEMLKLLGASDAEIAAQFGVNVRAVQKRREEVKKERDLL